MRNKHRAETAAVIALRRHQDEGGPGLTYPQWLEAAQQVPVEPPPRLHRLGSAMLRIFGREARPYQPDYSWELMLIIGRLEEKKWIIAFDDYPPDAEPEQRLPSFRLTKPSRLTDNQSPGSEA